MNSPIRNSQFAIPTHIAIIMDGNRRWARAQGLPVLEGHRRVAGVVLEKLVEHAADCGIDYLTFWAFSTENWGREVAEVSGIMMLLRQGLKRFGQKMHKKGVRIRMIGDMTKFDGDIQKEVAALVDLTKHNERITVVFALNYGGRDELVRAVFSMIHDSQFTIQKGDIADTLEKHLDTKGIPDPDIIVRTGGEQRLSGFLPWQSVYSELYFPSWYMPDFSPVKLDEVIAEFGSRKRRFGK